MKHGVPTCREPRDPAAFYFRCLYHEFFYGPFASEAELAAAINLLDRTVAYWDDDPFCIVHGADPLPTDFVFGFPSVDDALRQRIKQQRIPAAERPQP